MRKLWSILGIALPVVLLVMAITGGTAWAENPKAGSAGAQFLKIGVGSKYQGMAEASVATANDVYAMYWNPAGLAQVDRWAVGFTNVNYVLDIQLNHFAAARYFEDVGVFGASVTVLSTGDQDVRTVFQQDGTGATYDASSYAIGLSYARQLTNYFAFGGSVKYLGEKIGQVDAKGVALDFGTLLYTGYRSLRVGMSITNMGPDMTFRGNALEVPYDSQNGEGSNDPVKAELATNPYNLPLTFRVGVAYDVEMSPEAVLTLSSEFKHPNDNEQRASLGAQFAFQDQFFLRGGYKFNYDEETLALGGGLTTTISGDTQLYVDYAWQDFGRLESTQRFSLGFTF
ncbi:PorV/PorQ family protein [candidate division GN15 bacterium]|nr:PorV/PorQ family protein [candidate division GN15 bacterium]